MIDATMVRTYIKQASLLFLSLALAMFAFAWVRVWVVSLLDMGQFQTILEQFRDFEKFAPISFDALFTYQGRVGMTFDEPIIIICVVIWCISRGSDVVSGEIGRGTMEMLLSHPIRRTQLLWSHATVAIVGLALLCLSVWGGLAIGVQLTTVKETQPPPVVEVPLFGWEVPLQLGEPPKQSFPLSERVDSEIFAPAVFNLFAFGFFLLGLSSWLSSRDRYRWRTIGIVMAIYVLQAVIYGLGKAAESLQWLLNLSFFSCYKPQKLVQLAADEGRWTPWSLLAELPDATLPPFAYPLLLLIGGAAFYGLAAWTFAKRDLPAPV
ncbi:ABC transporter permease subunit [Roseiconus lacunae]|uniref:ABC transporter permease subunit n=1 Tax=Roseiconus lacunae TaxID=2605694 RepID=A0ABT7PJN2_9BACT|nr:ABC transporter permease subunit [Roseiconus lacunae]MCD0459508.1 ABC transporter permease subunit [Roseiconus lacunae]MDM4016707.1 ABC transporter permease subunit [Roseiconus lacunae]WRQ50979.1 ABC transporter permease subunit [Stieleria sp. HD01]